MSALVKQCKVIGNFDPHGCGRVLVWVAPEDNQSEAKIAKLSSDIIKGDKKNTRSNLNNKNREETAFAFPLLPKNFYVIPKVGEYVFVLTTELGDGNSQRYYIGPIYPQISNMYDASGNGALAGLRGSETEANVNPSMIPETSGAFPKIDDVSIEGRKNCSIQLTDDDVRIKAGVKRTNTFMKSNVKFNKDNTKAFVMVKYNDDETETPTKKIKYHSTANVVADKINLLGNTCKINNDAYNTNDEKDLITDENMIKILDEAHELPYGDVLVDVLQRFWYLFVNHSHEWIGKRPKIYTNNQDEEYEDKGYFQAEPMKVFGQVIKQLDDNMLSDNVRIN